MATPKRAPSWVDVKTRLAGFDRAQLLALVHDLYAASPDNRTFLHTRFGLGTDVLQPYKAVIDRWLWPDLSRRQDTSVAKAKKAVTDYRKAVGHPEGLAELMTFFCERAIGFALEFAPDDEGYFDALILMFEQALKAVATLPEAQRPPFQVRLREVHRKTSDVGYGVEEAMERLLARHGLAVRSIRK